MRWLAALFAIVSCQSRDVSKKADAAVTDGSPSDEQSVSDETPAPDVEPFKHAAQVASHVDGDTLEVRYQGVAERIRVLGVDTPETYPEAEPFAKAAQVFTRKATPKESDVGLEFDDADCANSNPASSCRDVYGRLLAYIRLADARDLGAELLTRGLARVYRYADFLRFAEYDALEQMAEKKALGIWSQ